MIPVLYLIALIALIIASYSDIKTREVPDWLNYSLIFIGLGIRLLYSVITWNIWIFLYGVFGFIALLILALLMYYLGQWGGGDSKMVMGLGALIGLKLSFKSFLLQYFILILLAGAVYGVLWSCILAIKHRKKFVEKFVELSMKHIKLKKILLIFAIVLFVVSFFVNIYLKLFLLVLVLIMLVFFYLYIFAKSVELACMHKLIPVGKLTEGDWIVEDVVVKDKRITGPKDLGISKEQIKELKELKVKKILIKEGIPFVPSFLIAFIISLVLDYYGIFILKLFV